MSDLPRIAATAPLPIAVEAGKPYFWCSCGLSAKQPFCDGSHKGTGLSPLRHVPEADGTAWFCTCKQSSRAPLCDGSHKRFTVPG
jgi:CDGSH iron-sulfur domain-containing protein 3